MHPDAHNSTLAEETRLVDVVFPDLSNHYGTLFGGNALSMMSKAAFLAATRHARAHVVMASTDKVVFAQPVRVGEVIECIARVTRVGRNSMTVSVELFREDALTGTRSLAVSGSFEMVAVDANGRPINASQSNRKTKIQEDIIS